MTLRHGTIELRPLADTDRDELFACLADSEVWRLMPIPLGSSREIFEAYLDRAIDDPATEAFAVYRNGEVVGSTRLCGIDDANRKAELGYTWYRSDVWGTEVNPAAKLLLLGHAFEDLGLNRVYFYVDARNTRSRAAVRKLGASEEGVLRADRILPDGHVRDTVVFSILATEWGTVREGLHVRLLVEADRS